MSLKNNLKRENRAIPNLQISRAGLISGEYIQPTILQGVVISPYTDGDGATLVPDVYQSIALPEIPKLTQVQMEEQVTSDMPQEAYLQQVKNDLVSEYALKTGSINPEDSLDIQKEVRRELHKEKLLGYHDAIDLNKRRMIPARIDEESILGGRRERVPSIGEVSINDEEREFRRSQLPPTGRVAPSGIDPGQIIETPERGSGRSRRQVIVPKTELTRSTSQSAPISMSRLRSQVQGMDIEKDEQ